MFSYHKRERERETHIRMSTHVCGCIHIVTSAVHTHTHTHTHTHARTHTHRRARLHTCIHEDTIVSMWAFLSWTLAPRFQPHRHVALAIRDNSSTKDKGPKVIQILG